MELDFIVIHFSLFQILIAGKYVIILGDYISSSVRTDNKNKDILVLGK